MALESTSSDVAYRKHVTIAATTILLVFSSCSFALRIWVRRRTKLQLLADDWLMGVGLVRESRLVILKLPSKE